MQEKRHGINSYEYDSLNKKKYIQNSNNIFLVGSIFLGREATANK